MKFKIGAKADVTAASGEYNNIINFVATGYSFPLYTVTYNANGGTVSPTQESTRSSVTLPTPTYSGYIFNGWCDGTVTGSTCNGTTYNAGATYTPSNNVTLTALWQPEIVDLFAISNMQDMTAAICTATTTPSSSATQIDTDGSHRNNADYVPRKALTDTRDGTTYLVSKLADGNCWMSQNLELKLTKNVAVTAYNWYTDTTFPFSPENTTQTTTGTTWAQDGSDGARSYAFANNTYYGGTDITQTVQPKTSGQPYEKAGALYNWYAATAGTGKSDVTSGSVYGSICPQGWRLPANTTGENKSFSKLASTYGLPATNTTGNYSRILQFPLQFNRSGFYWWELGSFYPSGTPGTSGYYQSSVGNIAISAYSFIFSSGGFYPQYDTFNKGNGFAVRCVND